MTVAAFVLALAALFVAVAAGAVTARRSTSLASLVKRRAIVTLKTGEAFVGVLYAVDRETLTLRGADAVGVGDKRVPVDGEVIVLRGDVAYVQLP